MKKHDVLCACLLSLGLICPAIAQPIAPAPKAKKNAADARKRVEVPLQPQEGVLAIDNVLQAKGQNVIGKNGVSLTLNAVEKVGDGVYRIEFTIEGKWPNQAGRAQMQIQGGARPAVRVGGAAKKNNLPNLVDAQGNNYQLSRVQTSRTSVNNGMLTRTYVAEYRAHAGQGPPARLELSEPGQPVQPPNQQPFQPTPQPPVQPWPTGPT